MNQNTPAIHIDGIVIPVRIDSDHEYTLTTAEVAEGYGVAPANIRKTLERHGDELLQGKHWGVTICHTLGGDQRMTYWTKRGIIRLGFFIRSERAKRFRDLAEDLIIRTMEDPASLPVPPVADSLARHIASFQVGTHGPAADLERLVRLHGEIAPPADTDWPRRRVHPEIAKLAIQPEVTDPFPVFLGDYYRSIGEGKPCRVTVAQLLAHGAPISHQIKDRRKACGKHLRHWVGRAFRPYGMHQPLTVTRHRTARSRTYLIQPYHHTQTPAYVDGAQ